MIETADSAIPFERQEDSRSCGAAALCMVYRSLGLACSQSEIWERIAQPGPWGRRRINTHQLCDDALHRGLAAVTMKAREPWRVLELSVKHSIRAILSHCLDTGSSAGHYTVLTSVRAQEVILHDPHFGPDRRLSRAELQRLWCPTSWHSEVTGNVLVVFARTPAQDANCLVCGTAFPLASSCPVCRHRVPLAPAAVLGCANAFCAVRTWERIFCPHCDTSLSEVVCELHGAGSVS